MSMNIKHVAKTHTGKKCVVVFRELPDEPHNCLVVDTDALPDWMHDDIMNAVESPGAQQSTDFYAYAERTVLTDGTNMLQALHKTGRLQKVPTDTITMTPNNSVSVGLTEINNIVREQNGDKPVVTPPTDQVEMVGKTMDVMESAAMPTTSNEGITDNDLAKQFLAQAKGFETEAKSLKAQAYELAPGLKPGPKKPAAKKESESVSD
jgi:hypothetical protein